MTRINATPSFDSGDVGLNAGQQQLIDANGSILSLVGSFENARGTSFADSIRGDSAANKLIGTGGPDTLDGERKTW